LFNFLKFQAEPPTVVVATVGSLCQMLERHTFSLETVRVLIVDEARVLNFKFKSPSLYTFFSKM